jgi:hypothetical protein
VRRLPTATVLFLAAGLAAACGGSEDPADSSRARAADGGGDAAVESTGGIAPDTAAVVVPDTDSAADPFAGFELDSGPAANPVDRRISLLLRNHDARTAIVYADAGAGEVLLDSVAPGSEARVDILSRAGTIELRSVTPEGELLRATEVSPGPDTIVDVIVGPAPSAP